MSSETPNRPSIRDRVTDHVLDGAGVSAMFLGERAVALSGEGRLFWLNDNREPLQLHDGGLLSAASDGIRLVTGGDDGRVVLTNGDGRSEQLAHLSGRWIDQVAIGAPGIAWSSGRTAMFTTGKGEPKSATLPSSVGGLAFFPKGTRLALAHYGGVTLWFPNLPDARPDFLEWKGSHLGVTVSQDGRFVVSSMQEPQLHGWRIADGRNMRMAGYPVKVRSFAWTQGGKFLATSGAESAILWPFTAKDGPMGVQPTLLGMSLSDGIKVRSVAGHPRSDVVAIGYEDGVILLVRITDKAEILLRSADGDPVTALAWRGDGKAICFATEGGKAGYADL